MKPGRRAKGKRRPKAGARARSERSGKKRRIPCGRRCSGGDAPADRGHVVQEHCERITGEPLDPAASGETAAGAWRFFSQPCAGVVNSVVRHAAECTLPRSPPGGGVDWTRRLLFVLGNVRMRIIRICARPRAHQRERDREIARTDDHGLAWACLTTDVHQHLDLRIALLRALRNACVQGREIRLLFKG
jgi:hypothetical protein